MSSRVYISVMKNKYQALLFFLVLVGATALIGSWFGSASVRDWYPTLEKPSWIPPAWVFGPVWAILYLLMAISIWLVWQKQPENSVYFWFIIQLGLNLLWGFLFFFLQSAVPALVIACFLWWAILMTMIVFWKYSRTASLLLIPYLAWISFAITLNLSVVTMQSFLRAADHF